MYNAKTLVSKIDFQVVDGEDGFADRQFRIRQQSQIPVLPIPDRPKLFSVISHFLTIPCIYK